VQCEGCTLYNGQVRELSFLHSRDVTYAAGRQGNNFYLVCYVRQGERVFEAYWTNGRGVEAMDNSNALLDMTVYGRQHAWEDSPDGQGLSAP
jgi:predicted dithiol-disulfide oxidoreductase (DUF899 family)